MSKKSNVKRPLNRSIIIASAIFVLLLGIAISIVSIVFYRTSLYTRYETQMQSIVNYIEAHIDHDDLTECAKTFVESEKYKELQAFVDDLIDNYVDDNFKKSSADMDERMKYKDVHYIYIFGIQSPEEGNSVYEICAANTTYEKENDPDSMMFLGDSDTEDDPWYDDETKQLFRKILAGNKDVYQLNESEWGEDYTLFRPLINSKGEHYALLAIDVSNDQIKETVTRNIIISIAAVIGLGAIFIVLLLVWMRLNVTKPLRDLENSVVSFAGTTAGKRNPDELIFTPPVIKSQNEVASLSGAVTKLSYDMRDYVKGMVAAEDEATALQEHVTEMNDIAYKDALTQVKNKASYDEKAQSLSWDIINNTAAFGIVMVDLNYLKVINDTYGHDKGNEYIVGSCKLVCDVFVHSPVYRVGGDEFLVVLEGHDYDHREKLLKQVREAFDAALRSSDNSPWNRYSAAIGMAIWEHGDDVEAVFNRADKEMYEAKIKMKAERA